MEPRTGWEESFDRIFKGRKPELLLPDVFLHMSNSEADGSKADVGQRKTRARPGFFENNSD